ncbi:hypothetical protein Mal15_12540 [Stieleria maiorica]|uniref:Uncharacterized protein n=1 Tax=Stieleria maiorica TaxID=2795974 RepID=A0A5B9MAF6_9BACT|nr:hypothetical protein [Stieleria maiorica]QEF97216.1 hypothetical protein Mal15_12540 [Stieleria maiorica]
MHCLAVTIERITIARTTILASLCAITTVGLVGCGQPPSPDPMVITDTGSDLRHDHKHFHGDPHRHDHDHQGTFKGAHSHPHGHAHRHAPAPHGGVIVSLRLTGRQGASANQSPVPLRPHVEIVTGLPERLRFYFLAESENGRWNRWDLGPSPPTVVFTAGTTPLHLELTTAPDEDGYTAPLSADVQTLFAGAESDIPLTEWVIDAAGNSFDISGNVVFRQGELDVLLD